MSDKVDYKRIQNIVESAIDMKVRQIIDEKMDEKLVPLQITVDATYKMVARDRDELLITQGKVDRHDTEIKSLQTFTGFATA
jgi:hypothetical protein